LFEVALTEQGDADLERLKGKVIVTGGLGFIASNYVLSAIRSGKFTKIVNIDSISYGANPRNLAELYGKQEYRFVKSTLKRLSWFG
jgi:dTDP-glucose 4,6-dehydratase